MTKLRSFVVAALIACAAALPVAVSVANAGTETAQESIPVIGQDEPELIEFDAELPSHEDIIVVPMTIIESIPKPVAKPVQQFRQPVLQFIDRGRYGFAG